MAGKARVIRVARVARVARVVRVKESGHFKNQQTFSNICYAKRTTN